MSDCPCCGHELDDDEVIPRTRLDKTTDTIWELTNGEWVDTGRTPSVMDRWVYALEPRTTPLLDLFIDKPCIGDYPECLE